MQNKMGEVRQLHELNVELIETLIVIGQRFIESIDRYGIEVEGRDTLAVLIGRAQRLVDEIGTSYSRNPVISDASYHEHDSDASDDNLPVPISSNA